MRSVTLRRLWPYLWLAVLLAGCAGVPPPALDGPVATSAGPAGVEGTPFRRQLWEIPSSVNGVLMQSVLYRPSGSGPFKLAVINHGSEEDAGVRARTPLPDYPALTAYLVGLGYAVLLPLRPGHGATGGPYIESQGTCEFPDYYKAGMETAASIASAVAYMRNEPFIKSSGLVIIGNSAGGWGVIAYDSMAPAAVAGIVDLAGGRGGHDLEQPGRNCAPDRLVAAAGSFGRTARLPSLWLYASNDTYFDAALSRRMYDAFTAAGGAGEYHLLPPVSGADGHALALAPSGPALWKPYLADFLSRLP